MYLGLFARLREITPGAQRTDHSISLWRPVNIPLWGEWSTERLFNLMMKTSEHTTVRWVVNGTIIQSHNEHQRTYNCQVQVSGQRNDYSALDEHQHIYNCQVRAHRNDLTKEHSTSLWRSSITTKKYEYLSLNLTICQKYLLHAYYVATPYMTIYQR